MTECSVNVITRGTTVQVEAIFYDAFDLPAAPASVEISFNYVEGSERKTASYPMAYNILLEKWTYNWETTGFAPGTVYWSIRTDPETSPAYAADGSFPLKANAANLGAEVL